MQMLGPLSDLTGEFITGKRSPSKVLQVRYPKIVKQVFFHWVRLAVFSSGQITTTLLYSYLNGIQIRMSI